MTNLTQTLSRIDPTAGFVQYVNTVKPYHSKLLDVLVEYIYTEKLNTTIKESWSWQLEFRRPLVDTMYSCGYGYRWDPTGTLSPESTPTSRIISATPQNTDKANSFLVEPIVSADYQFIVTDLKSSQLAFTRPYAITFVNPTERTITVAGDLSAHEYFLVNDYVFVVGNAGVGTDGTYTVTDVSVVGEETILTMSEPVSLLATASGYVHMVMPFEEVPYWPSGTTVKLSSSESLPVPAYDDIEYHFIPGEKPGYFNLATARYPQDWDQFLHFRTLGVGTITLTRTEPFVPGDSVKIFNTSYARNDGSYIVGSIEKEGNNFRVYVLQMVQRVTPIGLDFDGIMTLDIGTYSAPSYCAMAAASDIHAETFIHEDLKFSFEVFFRDKVGASVDVAHPIAPLVPSLVMPGGYDTHFFDLSPLDGYI